MIVTKIDAAKGNSLPPFASSSTAATASPSTRWRRTRGEVIDVLCTNTG